MKCNVMMPFLLLLLQALADPKRFESEFLSYLSTPRQSMSSIGLIRHLSMHARNERYLTDRDHPFITVSRNLLLNC